MTVTVISCTKWVEEGDKVVLTEFDCFPSIQAHGPMTWTPADKTIEFKTKKPWTAERKYTIKCSGEVTEKGGTQCYTTKAGSTMCSDRGITFSMEGGSVSGVQLIFFSIHPRRRRSR